MNHVSTKFECALGVVAQRCCTGGCPQESLCIRGRLQALGQESLQEAETLITANGAEVTTQGSIEGKWDEMNSPKQLVCIITMHWEKGRVVQVFSS